VQTAAPESGEPPAAESAVALTASSARALDESAAKVAQPREAEAKTIDTPPQAAVRQPNAATAEQQVARDAAALNDAAAEPAERAPAMQPNLLAEARKALRDENRSPPMDKASPPRAPIAEALAALGAKQAEGASASAKGSANEHNFEQLLASRALAAPRAEPATQAVPFANLLAPQPTTSPAAVIATPVDQAGFAQDFGNRVLLLATGHVKSAELALTPPDLGPVRVNIEVRGQDASISFVASAAATRAALEDALPKLREMFAQQGLNLLDASVGAQVGQQGHRAYGRPQAVRGAGRNDGETPLAVDAVAGIRPAGSGRPVRLIDVIA
jgi:flagellar hook-length control protein FliK